MKLSEETIMIWTNMAKINPHLVIEKGCKVRTVDSTCSTIVEYECPEEEFPFQVAFHDLGGFLRVLSLFDDPNFDFQEDKVIISDSKGTTQNYYYSETTELIYKNGNTVNLKFDINFKLCGEKLSKALKASSINKSEDIAFVGEHGDLLLKVLNKDETNPEVNLTESKRVFTVTLDNTEPYEDFTAFLKHSVKSNGKKINLLPLEEYQVSICKAGAMKFEGYIGERKITYIYALVPDSKFN